MTAPAVSILVVDDHALVREMLASRLATEDYLSVVGTAGDAATAVGIALERRPDIVLMDVDMPGLSAFDAAREITEKSPRTRVLFISGYLNDSYIEEALALEAAGYISKSEPIDAIIRAVHSVSRGGIYFSPQVRKRLVVDTSGARLIKDRHTRVEMLTERERQILVYIARGLAKKQIAKLAAISPKTVDQHCSHIMDKLDIHDRVALARFAIREGLVEP